MSLTLYFHPLSSFCQKALVALYENDTPFTPRIVDLGDAASSAEMKTLWPLGKFPVLRDGALGRTVPEASIIIEHLAQHYPGKTPLVPADPLTLQSARRRTHVCSPICRRSLQSKSSSSLWAAPVGSVTAVQQMMRRLWDQKPPVGRFSVNSSRTISPPTGPRSSRMWTQLA